MGIRKLDWNDWIQMDSNFLRYHDLKASELKKDLSAHIQYVDDRVTRDACFEVLEELVRYLPHRYPGVFRHQGNLVENVITKETFALPPRKLFHELHCFLLSLNGLLVFYADLERIGSPTEALKMAALMVQDDLILMIENEGELGR